MARGGARNRSGPQADPNSERSERRGVSLNALPAVGYDGPVPDFPLPRRVVSVDVSDGNGGKYREVDEGGTAQVAEREAALWEWAWSTPQAAAWAMPSEAWRLHTIAMWVRTHVLCESGEATAADRGSLHRFADQIGMTPAGLKENGWAIKTDDLADHVARRAERTDQQEAAAPRERRMRKA